MDHVFRIATEIGIVLGIGIVVFMLAALVFRAWPFRRQTGLQVARGKVLDAFALNAGITRKRWESDRELRERVIDHYGWNPWPYTGDPPKRGGATTFSRRGRP